MFLSLYPVSIPWLWSFIYMKAKLPIYHSFIISVKHLVCTLLNQADVFLCTNHNCTWVLNLCFPYHSYEANSKRMMMKYGIALLMSSYVVIQYICHHTIYVVIQYTIYVTLQYTIYVIIELLQMEYIDDYTHYQAFIWVKFLHWDVWSHHLESIPEVLSWENGPLWLWYVWSCS